MGHCSSTLPVNHSTEVGGIASKTTAPMKGKRYHVLKRNRNVIKADQHKRRSTHENRPSSTSGNNDHESDSKCIIPSDSTYPPPANAIRKQCYKLNLNAESVGALSNSSASKPMFLGPYKDAFPACSLQHDSYDDDSDDGLTTVDRDVATAIQTAQIFRGITVSPTGTILSQNARATRYSNYGTSSVAIKKSEKSRQAATIDTANNLIDQNGSGNADLISLVVIGEYDNMECLIRDGSKKLRDAADVDLSAMSRPSVSSGVFNRCSPKSQSSAANDNDTNTSVLTEDEGVTLSSSSTVTSVLSPSSSSSSTVTSVPSSSSSSTVASVFSPSRRPCVTW